MIDRLRSCLLVNLLAWTLLCCGCSKQTPPLGRPWHHYVQDLTNIQQLAVLDGARARLVSSFDRQGGNNDYNNFEGEGTENGWVTLVSAKGPGCVRRLWMTGMDFGHPIRIYFDGERKPRIEGSVEEVFGQRFPLVPPLGHYVNMGFHTYIPLTFQDSIRIETKAPNNHPFWGPRRIFYQANVEQFPATSPVESFPRVLTTADRDAVERVRTSWWQTVDNPAIDMTGATTIELAPGEQRVVHEATAAGLLGEFAVRVEPVTTDTWSRVDREFLLQDTILAVTYDDQSAPSISTPLGDFFANGWRGRSYGSLLLTAHEGTYRCRMPLPYKKSIRIEFTNGADKPVRISFLAKSTSLPEGNWGYLHAVWRRSPPEDGQDHLVADFKGKGKFVGCFLGVTGLDSSWWILEGDEVMYVDGEGTPSWHGTGLEDYFNGAWYYRGSYVAALNGIFDRSPFRVGQFRHHLVDPISFDSGFHMKWERMPNERSAGKVRGFFQTVAYAYLEQPSPVPACPADRLARRAVDDPLGRQTFMLQLVELERMNNFKEALDYCAEYLERYPDAPEAGMYRLRMLEYRRLLGEAVDTKEYEPFYAGQHGPDAAEQAKLLLWFYAKPTRAIVGLYVNGSGRLFLDGRQILSGDHPFQLFPMGIEIGDGSHTLGASVTMVRDQTWYQAGIRTHGGVIGTGLGTWSALQTGASWQTEPIDTNKWHATGIRNIGRGEPDAPLIGGVPNALILVQSKAYPIGAEDWGYYRGTAYFRTDFAMPVTSWPAHARSMTGLAK